MNREQKDLLLKELCARLPYGVKCDIGDDNKPYTLCRVEIDNKNGHLLDFIETKNGLNMQVYLSEVKPYLLPISSSTKEQVEEFYNKFVKKEIDFDVFKKYYFENNALDKLLTLINDCKNVFDWFYKKHIDCFGFIDMGLAKNATNL